MEDGLKLPWWEFRPTDFTLPGTVEPPDSRAEERLLAGFLQAGARAETADFFISANSLNVAGVLDALCREELVLPPPRRGRVAAAGSVDLLELPQVGCRSRLFGMPLADRHAALTAACSLRHRLPRRALVNFLCRLVLGKDVGRLPSPSSTLTEVDDHYLYPPGDENNPGARSWETGPENDACACGNRTRRSAKRKVDAPELLSGSSADATRSKRFVAPGGAMGEEQAARVAATAPFASACRSCCTRREWLDSCSVQLLVVACSQLLWDKSLPEDEGLALKRCLSALSEILGQGDDSRTSSNSRSQGHRDPAAAADESRPVSGGRSLLTPAAAAPPIRARVGVSALLAGVRRRRCQAGEQPVTEVVPHRNRQESDGASAGTGDGVVGNRRRPRGDTEETGGSAVFRPSLGAAKKRTAKEAEGRASPLSAGEESASPNTLKTVGEKTSPFRSDADVGLGVASGEAAEIDASGAGDDKRAAEASIDGSGGSSSDKSVSGRGETEREEDDCLAPAIRQQMDAVAEKVAAAGARGATSADVQGAAAATVSLLEEAVKSPSKFTPSATNTTAGGAHLSSSSSRQLQLQQQQQPLEAVCGELGLHLPRGKAAPAAAAAAAAVPTAGCGDDLVMAVCDGFVTPALSLKNCLAFVRAVLVPRARALTTPASRLLVTAVSGIGKARPGVVIDGLILPLLCEGDPSTVGSAQCELCTRLIKQVLPKHALEAVLVGLCDSPLDESARASAGAWGGVSHGGGAGGGVGGNGGKPGEVKEAASSSPSCCVWTELTTPVITAALNLKPALSDKTIAALVRGVEAGADQPKLLKSLKFTTLIHSMVNRYGPQLKPHVPTLRAAVGRCSNFMVKAVLAALQRLDR